MIHITSSSEDSERNPAEAGLACMDSWVCSGNRIVKRFTLRDVYVHFQHYAGWAEGAQR